MTGRFRVGEWAALPELNSLERDGHAVHLEPKVMQVLVALGEHPGEVVSKEHIFNRVWPETFVSDEVLTRSISELRKVFEDNPQDPKYIQTIPKSGYRLVAPVVQEAMDRSAAVPGPWWKQKTWKLGAIATIILLGAAASLYILKGAGKNPSGARITSLAVLPLVNLSGDAGQEYFADGMTDELTTRLSGINALRVISRTSVTRYKGTQKTTPEIARELNVDAILEGSVVRSGDRVRISAQLIQANPEKQVWAESYERDLRDVLALQSEVARTVAKEIRIQVTPQEDKKLKTAAAVNPQAHDSYLRGLYYWNRFTEESLRKAVDSFEDAIQKEPNYAPAYAGLANTYHELAYYIAPKEVMPKGREAATRALELDSTDAEAHAALGWIKWHYDWDWSGAEREYTRAIELNPTSGMAHGQYALFLAAMGRFEEALREHQLTEATDPLSLVGKTNLGDILYNARWYDEAIERYRQVLELDANFAIAQQGLGAAYLKQGKLPEAIAHLQSAGQLDTDPGYAADLGYAYALAGEKVKARGIVNQLIDSSRKTYISPTSVALVYLGIGEERQSCEWLERGYVAHDSDLAYIRVDPLWDKLKPNPCFQSIMYRMGVPK